MHKFMQIQSSWSFLWSRTIITSLLPSVELKFGAELQNFKNVPYFHIRGDFSLNTRVYILAKNPYFSPPIILTLISSLFFAPKIRTIAHEIDILRVQILLAADFGANVGVFAYILIENAFVEEIRVF